MSFFVQKYFIDAIQHLALTKASLELCYLRFYYVYKNDYYTGCRTTADCVGTAGGLGDADTFGR